MSFLRFLLLHALLFSLPEALLSTSLSNVVSAVMMQPKYMWNWVTGLPYANVQRARCHTGFRFVEDQPSSIFCTLTSNPKSWAASMKQAVTCKTLLEYAKKRSKKAASFAKRRPLVVRLVVFV